MPRTTDKVDELTTGRRVSRTQYVNNEVTRQLTKIATKHTEN